MGFEFNPGGHRLGGGVGLWGSIRGLLEQPGGGGFDGARSVVLDGWDQFGGVLVIIV